MSDLEGEIAQHRNRIVELKADLHDLDAKRDAAAQELADEQTILATLEAMAETAPPRGPATARRTAKQQEG